MDKLFLFSYLFLRTSFITT